MKTESLPTQDSDAAGSTGAHSERTLIHHNSELSQHLKEYLVAQLQDKSPGQPNQAPAGFWHQAPQATSSDYQLPPADKIIQVKLSPGETTFHVPANTTFDTIHVVGHDLVLVQKDGTAIVLEDAGDKIPNIEIGDVDVPKVALEAAFTANGIQAAEGPSGNSSPSSGGNFEDERASTLGNGRGLTGLLGQEGFNFNGTTIHYPPPPLPEIRVNTNPEPTLTLSESHLTAATNGIDGSDPDAALTTITGNFSVDFTPTADVNGGVVTYALSIHGGNGTASGFIDSQTGLADVLVQNGNTIEGHVGNANGALAFTISVNPNTGVVTFTEDRAVFEAQTSTNPSDNIATMSANVVTLTATITDGLGHQASASLDLGKQISLTDDAPSIVADAATVPGLTLSEADLTAATNNGVDGSTPNAALTSVTGHFAGDFTDTSGADGLKSTTYALSIVGGNGVASGLVDSQTGQADVLVQNGNTIEGHVGSANGALAFTITLDPATGDITFTEDRAIQNNDTGSTGVSLAAGVVTLTQTLVDNDGSTASATVDLGPKFAITDDGPSIVANAATVSGLTLSETNLTATTNNGVNGTNPNLAATSVVGHFAGDFTDTSGADGLKSTTYALSIVGGSGTASGLIDSQTGQADVLVQNGNTIEGHVGGTGGALAFTIAVDPATGDITFTEDRAVENNNTGSTGVSLSAGVVTLTQTITDNDGTTASANVDIGPKLSITDDGPSITTNAAPTLTLSESNLTFFTNGINGTDPDFKLTHTSADFSTAFTDTSGADGLKSVAYALSISHQGVASGLIDSQTGQADILFQHGNTITGFVGHTGIVAFTITIDPKTGELTFTEDRAVVQTQDGSDPSGISASLTNGVVTLTQTITDNDGTTASASVDVGSNLSITDDGPKISTAPFLEPGLVVSESHLTASTNGVSGSDPNSFLTHASGNFSFAFVDTPGADGIRSIKYALSIGNGGVSGLVDSQTGLADVLVLNTKTGEIEGHVGSANGALAFTISVDAFGTVTFTEDRAVVQAQNGHDPSQDLASFAAGAVTLTQTLVDNDGTTTSASLDISKQLSIADDGPSISLSLRNEPVLTVSEADLTALQNGVDGTVHNGLTTATGNFSVDFIDTYGADGKAASGAVGYTLSIGKPAPHSNVFLSGLVDSQTHQNDVLVQINATTIEGHVGSASGALAFTISVDPATGIVTFTEDRAVVQLQNGQDPSGTIASLTNSAVVLTQTITDGDGTTTSASLGIGAQLQIKDDGPHIVANSATVAPIVLSESDLTNGTTPDKALTTAVGQFAGDFTDTYGADGKASSGAVSYALSLKGFNGHNTVDSGLIDTLTGSHDVLVQNGNTITAYVGSYDSHSLNNIVAFTITLNPANGDVTFTEDRSVENNGSGAAGISIPGLITLTQTITDGDGTSTSAGIDLGSKLAISDDTPTDVLSGAAEPTLTVHEANLTASTNGGNAGTVHNGLTSATGNFAANFTDNFGADGQAKTGAISYALTVGNNVSGLVDTQTGDAVKLVQNGNGEIDGVITISGHVTTVFTITVDATGNVTFTEDRAVKEVQDGSDPSGKAASLASGTVLLTQTITDGDGTSTTSPNLDISKQLSITDDGPQITIVAGNEPTLTLSESNIVGTLDNGFVAGTHPDFAAASTTASFSSVFTDVFGADGKAATGATTYSLTIGNNGDSGLKDTLTGEEVMLVKNGSNEVDGIIKIDGFTFVVFTVKVDASGNVTFTEDRSVENNNTGSIGVPLASGALMLGQTLTDGDGTTTSQQIDLGAKLAITDDAPTITVFASNEPTLTLSETHLPTGTDHNAFETTTIGYFGGGLGGVFSDNFGADGAAQNGAVSYALSIGNNADSGLKDTLTGQEVMLVAKGGEVDGVIMINNVETTVFTISVNSSGFVTFTEDRAVENNNSGSAGVSLASGAVTLTQTIQDGDGTTESAGIDLGSKLAITDDRPEVSLTHTKITSESVSESNLPATTDDNNTPGTSPGASNPSATENFAAAFSDNFGADGPESGSTAAGTSYALTIGSHGATNTGLIDTLSGDAVTLKQVSATEVDGVVTVGQTTFTVFTYVVDSSGQVTFTLERSVENNSASASLPTNSVTLTQTLTDGDGSTTTSGGVDISKQFSITDDTPQIVLVTANTPAAQSVSESDLPTGTTPGTHSAQENFSTVFADTFGADGLNGGAVSSGTAYALSIGSHGPTTGLADTLTSSPITLHKISATEIDGKDANGDVVFKITVDQSGNVTFELDRPVENNSGPVTLLANSVTLTQTITDGDGSKASDSIDISQQFSITDDVPKITVNAVNEPALTLSETFLPNGTAHNSSDTSVTKDFSPVFSDNFGADGQAHSGAVSYALSIGNGGDSGLKDTLSGQEVTLVQKGSGEVDGVVTINNVQTTVFTITVDSNGHVTFTEDRAVENNNTGSAGAALTSSAVVLTQTITDGDGSTASASVNIGSQLSITDDAPKAPVLTVSNTFGVDETPGVQTTGGANDVLYSSLPTAIAALFSGLANVGTDTNVPTNSLDHGALSFAASGSSLVSVGTPVFGADGAASSNSETYALKLEGTASGLTLTDGTAITLSISNGMIIGAAGTDSVNSALSGKVAFAIAIDSASGEVYVAQYLSLHQPNASNPNDSVALAANSVGVTVTLTDGDGSQASTSADVSSHIQFYDDGPTIAPIAAAFVADVANSSFNGTWGPTFGADGPSLTTPVSLAVGTAPAGLTYNVTDTGHQINGHEVFEVQVGGSASYTFYEYTSASATGAEMFAFTDQAGANPFFTLDVLSNGNYTFDLESTTFPGGGRTVTFASGGEHDFFYSANGATSLTGGDYSLSPNFGVPGNYDVLITAGGAFNDVDISNGKMGVDGNQLNPGETLDFVFGTAQTAVTIGVAPGSNAPGELLEVTIWNASGTQSHTETYFQPDGTSIIVDEAHWVGAAPWFAGGVSEVDVTNLGGFGEDNNLSLTSISTGSQSATVPPTTLDFNVGATDGDGDSASTTLAVNLVTPPTAGSGTYAESVSESSLPTGSSPTGHSVTGTVQVSFTAGTDADNVTLDPSALTTTLPGFQGLTWQVVNGGVEGFQGSTEVVSFAITSGATIQAGQTATVTITETLLAPIDGDNGGSASDLGTLNVIASDVNNSSINAADQVTVGVLDDAPKANAFTASDTSGQTVTSTASTSLFGASNSNADKMGADGPSGGNVVGVEAGNHTSDVVTTGAGTQIAGTYGTLTLNQDGTYSYTANPDTTGLTGTKTDTFTYTLKDGDGSTATSTLTFNVNEVHPTASAVTGTVYEAGLPNGSGVGPTMTELQGTLPFSESGDTVKVTSIVWNGVTIPIPQDGSNFVLGVGAPGAPHAHLTINDTGAYTYQLIGPETASGGVQAPDVITYTVTDSHGNTSTNTLTFTVVDDKPVAVADVAGDTSGHQIAANVITGVGETSGADTPGADGGLSVIGVEAGNHTNATVTTGLGTAIVTALGTLTMDSNGDGGYTYTAKPNESGTDTFTYTVKDADGSTSTTTLTINVNEVQPTANAATGSVSESGLSTGSNPNTAAITQTGTLSFGETNDTVTIVSVNGQNVTQSATETSITGAHGTLQINENGSYTYTLTSPETGNTTPDTFTYTVKDAEGNTNTSTLAITIVDDKPVANEFTASVQQGAVLTETATSGLFGTVTGDKIGADGPSASGEVTGVAAATAAATSSTSAVSGHVGQTVTDADGSTLALNADGSFTFTASATATVGSTDYFTYTITDADGSKATNTLAFAITAPPPPQLEVFEAGLSNGTSPGSTSTPTSASMTLSGSGVEVFESLPSAPSGYEWIHYLVGAATTGWELVSESTGNPALQLILHAGVGFSTLTENLVGPIDSPATNGLYNLGSVTVNTDGTRYTVTVGVADDAPVANAAALTAADGTTTSVTSTMSGLFGSQGAGDVYGADGPGDVKSVSINGTTVNLTGSGNNTSATIAGQFGTLTIHDNGTYSYVANHNDVVGSKDVFTYTLTDADGSTSSNTLTVTVGAGATPQAGTVSTALSMNESLLASGSGVAGATQHQTATASFTAGADDLHLSLSTANLITKLPGGETITWSGNGTSDIIGSEMQNGVSVNVVEFTLSAATIAAGSTGSVTVTEILDAAIQGNNGESSLGTLGVVGTTINGASVTNSVGVNVVDDKPVFQSADHLVITSSASSGDITGNINYLSGADSPATLAFTGVSANEKQQTTTSLMSGGHAVTEWIDAAGVLHGVANGQDVFTVTLNPTSGTYDLDLLQDVSPKSGSSATLAFSFNITDNDGSQATGTADVTVVNPSSMNYEHTDSGLAPFNGSYHELTDNGASSSSPYTLIGDSSNDIFLVNFANETMQAHSATSGDNIFEIANLGSNELITNFNATNDVIDLTQLLSNVNTAAPSFNINNYVEYNNSNGTLEINTTGGGFGAGQSAHIQTVATLDSTTQTGSGAPHPQSPTQNPTILIAYQDQSHLAHSAHIHG